ncbi:MAG TPA: peptide chain release factor N(5)-glutamine methyltransferase [Chitinophagaceae bacterium]|nr:peptide chain release factor N(5)-glutamine methyltransferase [Chitinophagaceae bacterium]
MKIGEAETWLVKELRAIYEEPEAVAIAAMVLDPVTGFARSERMLHTDEPLLVQQLHQLTEMHHRLLKHEPVQYILGIAHFYGLQLFVQPGVLIPRPETEELVDWICKDVKASGKDVFQKGNAKADETTLLKILDIGTGSGCIALALKKALPKAEVWGCDVSDEALGIARRNGSELNIRADFVGLDFLDEEQQKQLPTVDIIVSNPPYISIKDKDTMEQNVIAYEPHLALFVPDHDPLLFYKTIARFAEKRLYENGSIYAEIHEDYGNDVVQVFEKEGFEVEVRKDMQGKDRMIKAVRRNVDR